MAQNLRQRISTSRLLVMIRSASTFREVTDLRAAFPEPRFHETLFELMQKRGLDAKTLISRSGIERAYFYHLLNGKKKPGRNVVLRIGFCLGSSLQEMNGLLRAAGLSELYARRSRDAALIYAVTHRCDMEKANALLAEAGEEPLYS